MYTRQTANGYIALNRVIFQTESERRVESDFFNSIGKLCIIAERSVNVGSGGLEMSIAKMKGKTGRTPRPLLALALLQESVADARGVLRIGRTVSTNHFDGWSASGDSGPASVLESGVSNI